jgi:SAM-dependent methyltransferase
MTPVANLGAYNASLSSSLDEKLPLIADLPQDVGFVVDYGCGDGLLLEEARRLRPNLRSIGYDTSLDQMVAATARGVAATTRIESVRLAARNAPSDTKTAMVLSSVVHELPHHDLRPVLYEARTLGADYIAIRDRMLYRRWLGGARKEAAHVKWRTKGEDWPRLREFERRWGSIEEHHHLVHYLLKYRYRDNWKRELEENYMVDVDTLLCVAESFGYVPQKVELYQQPWLGEHVKEAFGFELTGPTHCRLLLKHCG